MRALEFDAVSYRYPTDQADTVRRLSFSVEQGSFHCIIGVSGCGKSTLFRLINGLLQPDAGTIRVGGRPVEPRGGYCGYMPQRDLLFPWRTVGENLALPLEIMGKGSRGERRDQIDAALADVGLEGCRDKLPGALSGGMRQRAAFARTMLTGSDLLLLDEPFSALDSYLKWQVELELMDLLHAFSGPVLFVTHSRDEVYRLCGTVCVLDHGRSEPEQPVRQLFDAPATLPACLLSGCKNISRARPLPDGRVEALDWGVCLTPGRELPPKLTHVGVRAHFLSPGEGENAIPCTVERVVEDVFSTVVLCATPGGGAGFSRLRWELPKQDWAAWETQGAFCLRVAPEHLLLLSDPADDRRGAV